MNVIVLLFAQARERAGCSRLEVSVPEGSRVADVVAVVRREHPRLEELWPHLAIALDGQLGSLDAPVRDSAEIALLPPVSGG